MPNRSFEIVGLLALLIGTSACADTLATIPCHDLKVEAVTCMQATVPEDYANPNGRKISLDVVIVKAVAASSPGLEPIFILEGGPGQRTTEFVDSEAEMWAQLRKKRDLVFVDQRGTGTTPDLHCIKADEEDDHPLIDLWPAKTLKNCAVRLARSADLDHYATSDAANDLDRVRKALGYQQIEILAYSYGTRLAQEYVRRYGQSVRAQVLLGPDAPGEYVPAGMARNEESSLQQVAALCRLDVSCRQTYPTFEQDIERLKSFSLKAGTPAAPDNGAAGEISSGMIASYLRYRLYSAEGSATLPRLFREMNDPALIAQHRATITEWREQFASAAPWGMYMSVVCNEDIPFIAVDAERIAARGTLLGSYRVDQQIGACKNWPTHRIPPDFHKAVSSDVPSLLVVGQLDPATPPQNSQRILSGLTNGMLIVVPNRSHVAIAENDHCLKDAVDRFLDRTRVEPPTECINGISFPPFDTGPSWVEKILDRLRGIFG